MLGRSLLQHSTIIFLRRSLIAACLMLSLLSAVIPFSAASANHLCTMECCAGKAPHMAGECSSHLAAITPAVNQAEPEALCGLPTIDATHLTLKLPLNQQISSTATKDDEAESCGGHHAETAQRDPASEAKAPGPASIAAASMTTPCGIDCGTCAAGFVRKPRPREQIAVAWVARARPPSRDHYFQSHAGKLATLRGHYEQPQPRGPPTSHS